MTELQFELNQNIAHEGWHNNKWKRRLLAVIYMVLFISLYALTANLNYHHHQTYSLELFIWLIYEDIVCHLVCWTTAAVCYHMILRSPSDSHTLTTLLGQYFLTSVIQLYGGICFHYFLKACFKPRETQAKLLRKIILQGKKTQYGQDFAFNEMDSIDKFLNKHPLTNYQHYEKYFKACINGQENVLFPGETDFITITTGTSSGKSKEFPRNTKLITKCFMQPFMICMCMSLSMELKELQKWTQVFIRPCKKYNERGILRGPSSSMFKTVPQTSSPNCAYDIPDVQSALYIHAIFALKETDSKVVFLQIAPIAISFFKLLEKRWEDVCADIEAGSVNIGVDIPAEIRNQTNALLIPDCNRANELRVVFKDGFKNLVPRIWPHCQKLVFLSSATYATQAKVVKRDYAGNVPIISNIHMATEGVCGLSAMNSSIIDDFEQVFTVTSNFFEFILFSEIDDNQPKTYLLHELKLGERYEIVITTKEGLYRYRTQDIIRVTGFQGKTPTYVLLGRTGDMLSLKSEKLHEEMVASAVKQWASNWDHFQVLNYGSTENIHIENLLDKVTGKLFYIIFVELTSDVKLTDTQKFKIDEAFIDLVEHYKDSRDNNSFDKARVFQVKRGTFKRIEETMLIVNPDSTAAQYKTPRTFRRERYLRILIESQIL